MQWKRVLNTTCRKFLRIFCASILIFQLGNFLNLLCALFHAHTSTHNRIFSHKNIDSLFSRFIFLCVLIDKWTKENIFWIVRYLYLPRYKTGNLNLHSKAMYDIFSKKNGWDQTFFYFTFWFCLIECYMSMWFSFKIRVMQISEIYVYKLIVLQVYGWPFKIWYRLFPNLISIYFSWKIKNLYVK